MSSLAIRAIVDKAMPALMLSVTHHQNYIFKSNSTTTINYPFPIFLIRLNINISVINFLVISNTQTQFASIS